MAFTSLSFIFIFLPLFLLAYALLPARWQKLGLLIGSLLFYLFSSLHNPFYFFLLLITIVFHWAIAFVLPPKGKHKRGNPRLLFLALVFDVGLLILYRRGATLSLSAEPALSLIPLGLSFYTLTHLAYILDVYRGKLSPEPSLLHYATFSAFFPKLTGPIVPLQKFPAPQPFRFAHLDSGLRDFIVGFGLKVLLADQLGGLWRKISALDFASLSTPLAWMGALAFGLCIYFNLYGYSRMAIGLGKMLGIRLPESFRHPYAARTMSDFWRRWHVTLGAWFRKYLYIPLGGSRCKKYRHALNLFLVWLIIGLWHGLHWNFVLWAMFLTSLIFLEKQFIGRILRRKSIVSRLISRVYMIFALALQWMLFAITELPQLGAYLGRLFGLGAQAADKLDFVRYLGIYGWRLALGVLLVTPLPYKLFQPLRKTTLGTIVLFAIFAAAVYCVAIGASSGFLYLNF